MECTVEPHPVNIVAMDDVCHMNRLIKFGSMKTGLDLIEGVCAMLAKLTYGCCTIVFAFDTCIDYSLKTATRDVRYIKRKYSESFSSIK